MQQTTDACKDIQSHDMKNIVRVMDTYLNIFDILAANIAQQWEDIVLAVSNGATIVH